MVWEGWDNVDERENTKKQENAKKQMPTAPFPLHILTLKSSMHIQK